MVTMDDDLDDVHLSSDSEDEVRFSSYKNISWNNLEEINIKNVQGTYFLFREFWIFSCLVFFD